MNRSGIRCLFLVAAAFLLTGAGCQTDRVSLDEARQIASGLQGPRFQAPPNSVDDILALVSAERSEDRARLDATTKLANATAPTNEGTSALARFHAARAEARQRLGRVDAAAADYQRAIDFSQKARTISNNEETGWRFAAGLFAINSGELVKGLHMIEEANRILRPDLKVLQLNELGQAYGRVMAFESMIAITKARLGDVAGAREALERARSVGIDFNSLISYGRQHGALTAEDEIGVQIATGTLSAANGRVAALSGNLAGGIDEMRLALQRLERYDSGISGVSRDLVATLRVEAHHELASMLAARGDVVEAEAVARQALVLAVRNLGRYDTVTFSALAKLGDILLAQGRYQHAEAISRRALADLSAANASPYARANIESRLVRAKALAAQRQWTGAVAEFRAVESAYREFAPRFVEHVLAPESGYATAALYGGALDVALVAADRERRWHTEVFGAESYASVEASAFLGAAMWRAGRVDEARRLLTPAAAVRLSASGDARRPFLAVARMEAIVGAYLAANGVERSASGGPGSVVETAFRLAEATRSGRLAESLNAAAARASAAKLPGLSDLIRQKDDVELKADAANRILSESLVAAGRDDPRIAQLRGEASRLAGAAAALRQEIDRRFPEYKALAAPPAADFLTVADALSEGEVLISIFDGSERTYVWAVPKNGQARLAVVDLGAAELANTIANLRKALAPTDVATLGDIPPFDVNVAERLYARLLRPVEDAFRTADHIIVVATGVVPSLPLAVLPTEPVASLPEGEPLFSQYRRVQWLVRRSASSYVPSAATLIAIRRLPPVAGSRPFIGFGDPVFGAETAIADAAGTAARGASMRSAPVRLRASPPAGDRQVTLADLPRLPDTAREITEVARALNANIATDVFLRDKANEQTVKKLSDSGGLAAYRVISFATHGLVPGELSGLQQPALALSNPAAAQSPGTDGLLTLDEVLGLRLDADWAVLSACNTGGASGAGSEALSGLGQAFFFAGSRALLVSNWPVHSEATTSLMIEAFRVQAERTNAARAGAMRAAMLELIDRGNFRLADGRAGFSYAHPLFWAPFSVIGDGGALHRRSAS